MDNIYTLNEVGAFIWEQLDGKTSNQEVCNKIIEHFEVSPEEAETDLTEFVKQLEKVGVVRKI